MRDIERDHVFYHPRLNQLAVLSESLGLLAVISGWVYLGEFN